MTRKRPSKQSQENLICKMGDESSGTRLVARGARLRMGSGERQGKSMYWRIYSLTCFLISSKAHLKARASSHVPRAKNHIPLFAKPWPKTSEVSLTAIKALLSTSCTICFSLASWFRVTIQYITFFLLPV